MNKEQRESLYYKAFDYYGKRAQFIVAIEEMSELQKELCKILREGDSVEFLDVNISSLAKMIEEIADVEIILEQIRLMYTDCKIDHFIEIMKEHKLRRLEKRIEENNVSLCTK